jgi:hypothetical protein
MCNKRQSHVWTGSLAGILSLGNLLSRLIIGIFIRSGTTLISRNTLMVGIGGCHRLLLITLSWQLLGNGHLRIRVFSDPKRSSASTSLSWQSMWKLAIVCCPTANYPRVMNQIGVNKI